MKGGLVSLFFISTKNFPSGFAFIAQKTDQSWRTSSRLFSGPWHGCLEGKASECYQPSQAVLAFLTKILSSVKVELRDVSYKMFSSLVSVTYFDGKLLKREDEKDLTQDG